MRSYRATVRKAGVERKCARVKMAATVSTRGMARVEQSKPAARDISCHVSHRLALPARTAGA
eukprot:2624847-Lingulodinium_polyedra.AAC.1